MKSKQKPQKKVKIGKLKKKCHALMREIVLLRDGGCVTPPPSKGHSKVRQAGHIIPSVKGGSRWSLWNVHEQCSSCNGRHAQAGNYHIYQGWFEDKFGAERWKNIRDESLSDGLKSYELEELLVQFGKILEKQKTAVELGKEFKPYFSQKDILSGVWQNG